MKYFSPANHFHHSMYLSFSFQRTDWMLMWLCMWWWIGLDWHGRRWYSSRVWWTVAQAQGMCVRWWLEKVHMYAIEWWWEATSYSEDDVDEQKVLSYSPPMLGLSKTFFAKTMLQSSPVQYVLDASGYLIASGKAAQSIFGAKELENCVRWMGRVMI